MVIDSFFQELSWMFLASGLGVSHRLQDYLPLCLFIVAVVFSVFLFRRLNKSNPSD